MQESNTKDKTRTEEPDSSDYRLPCSSRADSANQNSSHNSHSPKVRFGEDFRSGNEKDVDGGGNFIDIFKKKRAKRFFKDIVVHDVIGRNQAGGLSWTSTGSPGAAACAKRGILKLRTETSLKTATNCDKERQSLCFVNKAYVGDDDILSTDDIISSPSSLRPPSSTVATTERSAFPYAPRRLSEVGFSGVVELLFQRTNLDHAHKRDTHPFGRDSLVEAVMEDHDDSAPKRGQNPSSAISKLVAWVVLVSLLVGTSLGLIFLSETYSAKLHQENLLKAALNQTQSVK